VTWLVRPTTGSLPGQGSVDCTDHETPSPRSTRVGCAPGRSLVGWRTTKTVRLRERSAGCPRSVAPDRHCNHCRHHHDRCRRVFIKILRQNASQQNLVSVDNPYVANRVTYAKAK